MSVAPVTAAAAERWLPYLMIALGVLGLYIIGLDKGYALAAIVGETAMHYNWLHELFHDARHVTGFPCH